MMSNQLTLQAGQTAVITGAGSGFGLELARLGAKQGLNLVLTDVQGDALDAAVEELTALGAQVAALRGDVSNARDVQMLADLCMERFGAPHLLVNNAGVAHGGLIWEHTQRDWEWVLGVNLWGVIHGVRIFTPLMLAAARQDAEPTAPQQEQATAMTPQQVVLTEFLERVRNGWPSLTATLQSLAEAKAKALLNVEVPFGEPKVPTRIEDMLNARIQQLKDAPGGERSAA